MVGESNQNVLLIQIDASSFAEFEISEFEISRVDCTCDFICKKVPYGGTNIIGSDKTLHINYGRLIRA